MRYQKYLLALLLCLAHQTFAKSNSAINWLPHDAKSFQLAEKDNKLLVLDVEAVWCHWCHVMDATTYQNAEIIKQLSSNFVPLKADHDARPDLAERYREYGWPATIILTPDGHELAKRAGYMPAEDMLALLAKAKQDAANYQKAVETRIPLNKGYRLTNNLRVKLLNRHEDSYDEELGGLQLMQKFLDADSAELDIALASRGDSAANKRVHRTLESAAKLIDPAFGGVYQYSTHGDWLHPHYEKIMQTQAAYLRIYSLAYQQSGEARYLQAAEKVADYLRDFMQDENGGFYNSQDADLVQAQKGHDYFALPRDQRLKLGLPRIDKNQYASTNGMLIEGLLSLYRVNHKKEYLKLAVKAFNWTLRNRRLSDGSFKHAESDVASLYLADNLYMARALLAMYQVSKQPLWLKQAESVVAFINANMRDLQGGVLTAVDNGTPVKPIRQIDQNIHLARFLIALYDETQSSQVFDLAKHTLRYLSTEEIALSRLTEAGIVLADTEIEALNLSQPLFKANKGVVHVVM